MIQYIYYEALRPDGTLKPGVNRIIIIDGAEQTREYVPEGAPEDEQILTRQAADEKVATLKPK